jgi:hypothetical protein
MSPSLHVFMTGGGVLSFFHHGGVGVQNTSFVFSVFSVDA